MNQVVFNAAHHDAELVVHFHIQWHPLHVLVQLKGEDIHEFSSRYLTILLFSTLAYNLYIVDNNAIPLY